MNLERRRALRTLATEARPWLEQRRFRTMEDARDARDAWDRYAAETRPSVMLEVLDAIGDLVAELRAAREALDYNGAAGSRIDAALARFGVEHKEVDNDAG